MAVTPYFASASAASFEGHHTLLCCIFYLLNFFSGEVGCAIRSVGLMKFYYWLCSPTTLLRSYEGHHTALVLLNLYNYSGQSVKEMAVPYEALAQYGGGDGSRTHVRIISSYKRYMLSLSIYELIYFQDTAAINKIF